MTMEDVWTMTTVSNMYPTVLYLQMVHGLSDAPAVTLQSGLTLVQRDPVDRPLHLVITSHSLSAEKSEFR